MPFQSPLLLVEEVEAEDVLAAVAAPLYLAIFHLMNHRADQKFARASSN